MYGLGNPKNLPLKNKFSYATAQQYSSLVRKSIDRQRSKSKEQKVNGVVSPGRLRPTSPRQEYRPARHLLLKQKIGERSRSRSQQDVLLQSQNSTKDNPTMFELKGDSKISKPKTPNEFTPKNPSIYEQEHLLMALQKQNSELNSEINTALSKISKLSSNIEEQRKSHIIQKQFYQQQLSKLKENLELQIMSREMEKSSLGECSLEEQLLLTVSENSQNEFLDMEI